MSAELNWSSVCSKISAQLMSNQSFIDNFKTLTTNSDKVKHCLSEEFVSKHFEKYLSITGSAKHRKYWEKAKEFRLEGNDCFRKKYFEEALEAYTQAILFASIPDPSHPIEANNELSLSFANRSAVFFQTKQFDNCLTDISMAFKYDYPSDRTKLLVRKADCFVKKLCFGDAKNVLETIDFQTESDNKSKTRIEELLKLIDEKGAKNPTNCVNRTKPKTDLKFISNELIPNANQSIQFCTSHTKGRYIVAKEDINVSDVLFMEKPFSSVLLPQYYKTHCNHCYGSLVSRPVLPCLKCSQVRYCSGQCVNDSWIEYHQYECGLLDVMHDIGIAHLAFRTVLVCGIDNAIQISTALSTDPSIATTYENNYRSVYALVDHSNDFPLEDSLNYSLVASLLLVLIKNLESIKTETKDYDILGGILLKHVLQLICNGHAISSMETIGQTSDFEDKRIATALYPTVSLMNHSCDPNVIAVYNKSQLIVRAAKPIAKGQEVMNCYGPHCKRMSTSDRKKALKEQYFFECVCDSCDKGIEDISRALLCNHCKDAIVFDTRVEDSIFCRNCQKNDFNIESMLKVVEKGLNLSTDGSKLIDGQKLAESEAKLLESHRLLETVLYSKNRNLGKVKDQLSRCYARQNKWSEAVRFGRQSVDIVSEVFGETSIELSNELIKLSELEFELFNTNQPITESIRDANHCLVTTSKALKLVSSYSIPGDDNSQQWDEIKKLEERLVFCDLYVKQFVKK